MSYADLLSRFARDGDEFHLASFDGWMQGRTLYGGAATLLGLAAVTQLHPGLPPLRAAQANFIAPIGGPLTATANVLRSGRNVTQVESLIHCGGSLAHRAIWLFGREAEDANARNVPARLAIGQAPGDAEPIADSDHAPQFLRQFEARKVSMGAETIAIRRWVRLKDRNGLDPVAELVGVADALPPGSLKAIQRPGPLSTMSWAFNVVEPRPITTDGWWLLESASEFAGHGYSGERMRLWNSEGRLMMTGLQSVAIFG